MCSSDLTKEMVKHNNQLPNSHFHKDWQNRVKTWFNQPGRKQRRRRLREEKAAAVFPRPASGLLRPVVHCPTSRYNRRVRAGRGFTLQELKDAGINRHEARNIGIAVDHRRVNHSEESLKANVLRLQQYKSRLVVFPKKGAQADIAKAEQLSGDIIPISNKIVPPKARKITDEERQGSVYTKLRIARSDARQVGRRAKRAAEKENKKTGI